MSIRMEELPCIPQPHSMSVRAIDLRVSALLASFTRLAAPLQIPRRKSPLCERENSLTADSLCPFDVDYEDYAAFQPNAESHLDQKLQRWDFVLSDPGPVTVSWDPLFDDATSVGQTNADQGLLLRLDLALEDTEFVAAFFRNLSYRWPQAETLRFLAFALGVHVAVFSLFFATPASSLRGFGGISDKPISVTLKETCEINTPDAPSPGSVDSVASMASLARRDPKSEEPRIRKEIENLLPTEVEPVKRETVTEPRPLDSKPLDEYVRAHSREPAENSLDGPSNNSRSLQDSIASLPSVASPERQGPSQSGDEVQTYKDLILSAIHDAAYYPRAALRNMAHGRTVVCFTIKKDGSLANIAIVSHAHSKVLDEAALKIVEKASAHFPPLPVSLMKDQVSYSVPIVFKKGL